MSFIRTDVSIFEVVSEDDKVYRVRGKRDYDNIYSKSKIQTVVEGQSDDVRDLIDEEVVVVRRPDGRLSPVRGIDSHSNTWVYGAIWTSKGLLFMTKKDSSGRHRLLEWYRNR